MADTATTRDSGPGATAQRNLAGKYLTFHLQEEVYGLVILKVQEIIGIMPVTKMPRMPGFVRGVINLRGKIIPVVDLRVHFGLTAQDDTTKTCIIVVQIASGDRKTVMGVIVDEVAEVISLKDEQIESTPAFGTVIDTDFILGMGKVNQKVIMLLDIDQVLTHDQIRTVEQTGRDQS
jgi:purine-binding chemotaxis protein CheW